MQTVDRGITTIFLNGKFGGSQKILSRNFESMTCFLNILKQASENPTNQIKFKCDFNTKLRFHTKRDLKYLHLVPTFKVYLYTINFKSSTLRYHCVKKKKSIKNFSSFYQTQLITLLKTYMRFFHSACSSPNN